MDIIIRILYYLSLLIMVFTQCVVYTMPPQTPILPSAEAQLVSCQIQMRTLILRHQYTINQYEMSRIRDEEYTASLLEYIQSLEGTINVQQQVIRHMSQGA